jgi:hypothetical protein|tara:strand:- start:755 stop:877 length:123 start_codon:yes stop_codon:yes gene_type:complete
MMGLNNTPRQIKALTNAQGSRSAIWFGSYASIIVLIAESE